MVKLQRSQYVFRVLLRAPSSKTSSSLQSLLSFLSGMSGTGQTNAITQDAADLFELVLATRMAQHLEVIRHSQQPLQFPGMHYLGSSWTFPTKSEFVRDVWPKAVSAIDDDDDDDTNAKTKQKKKKKKNNENIHPLIPFTHRKVCTPTDMSNEIRRLMTKGESGVYEFLLRGKSKSADVYLIIVDFSGGAAKSIVIGIQAKSGSSEEIGPTKLKEEWEKFWNTCPQGFEMEVHYVLIVAAMKYSSGLTRMLNTPALDGMLHLKNGFRYFSMNQGDNHGSNLYLASVPNDLLSTTASQNIQRGDRKSVV